MKTQSSTPTNRRSYLATWARILLILALALPQAFLGAAPVAHAADTCVTSSISQSSDDAMQGSSSNSMYLTDTTLYTQSGAQRWWGLRFQNITIPNGATITSASITFRSGSNTTATPTMNVYGEASDNASTFTTTASNISNRSRTASVAWAMTAWTSGSNYTSADLTTPVQAIVNRSGWSSGNAMAFLGLVTTNVNKIAVAWDDTTQENQASLSICYNSTTPTLTTSVSTLSGFNAAVGQTSIEQNYAVSGTNLSDAIIVTAPTDFQVSLSSGTGFGTSVTTAAPTGGTVASTPIYVRLVPTSATTYTSLNITHASGATTKNVAVSGSSVPTITTSVSTLTGSNSAVGSTSAEQSYNVSGTNLTDDIVITPPIDTDIEISTSSGSGFIYYPSTLTISKGSGTVTATPIYVHLKPTSAKTYTSLNIVNASVGATTQNVAVSGSSVPTITTTSSMTAFSAATGVYSAEKSYTVSGINLTADIVIVPPADFEVSKTTVNGFVDSTGSLSLPPAGGVVSSTTIYTRFKHAPAGTSGGNITHDSTGATQRTVAVSGTAYDPTITVTSSMTPFKQTVGSPSPGKTYTIAGTYLKGDITVNAPPDFEISKTTGGTFLSTLAFAPTSGTLATTTVYVRMNRSTLGTSSGDITHASLDAVTKNVTVSGTATNDICVTSRISASTDDAEERMDAAAPGYVDIDGDSTNHHFQTYRAYGSPSGTSLNYWGLRFLNVNVPQGATISSADVTFRALATNAAESGMTLWGQLVPNPTTFVASTSSTYDISSTSLRPRTTATTAWTVPAWTSGSDYLTPDLSTIVQEIVNQSDWAANHAMVIVGLASVNQNKTAAQYDSASGSTLAPLLSICYSQNNPTITTVGTLSAFSAPTGTPSAQQSYAVSGANLSGDVTITPPLYFELSQTSGAGFSTDPVVLNPSSGTILSTPIYVRLNPTGTSPYSGSITHTGGGATTKSVAVSGTSGAPTITVASSMAAFNQTIGSPSAEKTYTISGTYLKGGVTVTAPADFEISKTTSTGFDSTLIFPPTNNTLASTTVYVRMNRSTLGSSSGNITHVSLDATTQPVAVSGVTTVAPTTVTFQEGVSSYAGNIDTTIKLSTPTTSYGDQAFFEWDTQDASSNPENALLQFSDIFGSVPGQVPLGSTITSAMLQYRIYSNTGTGGSSGNSASVYESLVAWDEATTYNTFGGDVGVQGDEYNSTLVATALATTASTNYTIDVTASLQRWSAGTANYGWVFLPDGADGVEVHSREAATADYRPLLTVNYIPPTTPTITTAGTLTPFSSSPGVYSPVQNYSVSGSNLEGNIVITPPDGFEVSTDQSTWYTSSSPLTLAQTGGAVDSTTIYVHLYSATEGTIGGNITHTSGALLKNLAVSGTVTSLPPNPPSLERPADNASCVATPPTLEVNVSDPDTATVNVSFYGRPTGGSAPDFTLIVLPDSQHYAYPSTYNATFYAQTQWIVDQASARNIVFVTHVGDIDDNDEETGWVVADNAFDTLDSAGVPYSVSIGNNDFTAPSNYSKFEAHFGVTRFTGKSWYGGYDNELVPTSNRNNYSLFSASGMDFIIVNLDYNPTTAELAWADGLLTTYSTRRAIVVSHNQLNINDTFSNQTVFDALKGHANLFLLLSGHLNSATDGAAKRLTDTGTNGQAIYSVMQDYQSYPDGGNGYLRIYRFSPANDKIYMTTYSPTLSAYETTDSDGTLTLAHTMPDGAAYQLIGTDTGVASGSNASISWSGLLDSTEYEWYAVVNGGTTTTTGPTWSFTTGDCIAPTLDIKGATADGDTPLAGDVETGYILETTNDPVIAHTIQFAAGTVSSEPLAAEHFGLYLTSSTMTPAALAAYYIASGVPEPYLGYLIGAANRTNPFVYINGTTVKLVDGAKYFVQSTDADMTVPDDFPLGEYTVAGKIKDLAGNESTVTLILVVAGDRVAPTLDIKGATADGDTPLAGDVETGYILETTNDPAIAHTIQFAAGTVSSEPLAAEHFGLYLTSSTVTPAALAAYYTASGVPEPYLSYLIGAANRTNPFVYINGTTVKLVDGAKYFVQSTDADMTVPDDFPLGEYTVAGKIKDLAGNESTVTLILVVAGDRVAPTLDIKGATADGDTPLAGDVEMGYILETTNDPAIAHTIQFAAGTVSSEPLAAEHFGLYLTSSTMTPAALAAYYTASGVPEPYLSYLIGAANRTNPFVYINGTTVKLVDGAKYFVQSTDADMTVPDDFPLGEYSVAGKIKDLAGNESTVTLKLIVAGDRTPPVVIIGPSGLSWEGVSGATGYQVWYSSTEPYFTPPAGNSVPPTGPTYYTFPDNTTNYYYIVRAVNGPAQSDDSNRVGRFIFQLVPGE